LFLVTTSGEYPRVGGETTSECEVSGTVERAPIVDTMKSGKVAFDVEFIIEGPINFVPPIV